MVSALTRSGTTVSRPSRSPFQQKHGRDMLMTRVPALGLQSPPGTVREASEGDPSSSGKSPLSFSLTTGALPGGIDLNPTTGQLLGTPTELGTFSFTVHVNDANGEEASQSLQVSIDAPH